MKVRQSGRQLVWLSVEKMSFPAPEKYEGVLFETKEGKSLQLVMVSGSVCPIVSLCENATLRL